MLDKRFLWLALIMGMPMTACTLLFEIEKHNLTKQRMQNCQLQVLKVENAVYNKKVTLDIIFFVERKVC